MKWTPAVDQAELEAARQRGYVLLWSVRSMAGMHWKRECWQQRRPYIAVQAFRTNGAVSLDLTPAGVQLTDMELETVVAAIRRHGEAVHRTDLAAFVGRRGFQLPRMPLARAERLASELAAVLRQSAHTTPATTHDDAP